MSGTAHPAMMSANTTRARRADLWFALATFVCVPLGVVLAGIANSGGREGAPWAGPLFWAGLVVIFAPAAASLLSSPGLSRGKAVTLILAVGLGLLVADMMRAPGMLTKHDELLHLRTVEDIARTGRLFSYNPLLPVSPYYPGLEIVTHAVMSATGLGAAAAGQTVIATGRVLLLLSLLLFLDRAVFAARAAVVGALLYMTVPSFFSFDAMFAYESLALPLAVFCLFVLREAQLRAGKVRTLLNAAGAVAALAVVVTHHATSYVLAAVLVTWTVATLLLRPKPRDPLPGGGWVPALLVAAIAGWLGGFATPTFAYLAQHGGSAWREIGRILAGGGIGRRLFESPGGVGTPLLERVVGIASVVLVVACLPFGVLYVRRHQQSETLARVLALAVLAYPAVQALRFTKSGWEIGSRAMAFVGLPLAFVLASGLERLMPPGRQRMWLHPLVTAAAVVVFVGGVIAGTAPITRMARQDLPGSYGGSIEGEGLAAAAWARNVLGPGRRMIGDSANVSLMGAYGSQRVLTCDDGLSISGFFLEPFGRYQEEMIGRHGVQYVIVDRRIGGAWPLSGFFFEKWERDIVDYGDVVDPGRMSRYDDLPQVDRVYDSGNIQLYDVRRIGR